MDLSKMKMEKVLNIPEGSMLKIHAMAKDCACFNSGECDLFNTRCLVYQDETIIECGYFVNAELPCNPELEKKIKEFNGEKPVSTVYNKTCKECGGKFKTVSKNDTYCTKCKRRRANKQKLDYKKNQSVKQQDGEKVRTKKPIFYKAFKMEN